jgi:HEAT repeat protein
MSTRGLPRAQSSGRILSYVLVAVVALALIGWLTARYMVKRQLIRSLGSRDLQHVRVPAAEKLLAMEKLEDALPAQPIIIRSKTAQALGEIRSDEAIRVLGVILRDQEEAPRRWAREALVKQGKRAVPVLMEALTAGGGTLDEAVEGLRQIGPSAAPEMRMLLSDRSAYTGASHTLARMGQVGIDALLVACYLVDDKVREAALGDLAAQGSKGRLSHANVDRAVTAALDNTDPKLKLSTGPGIKALGLLGETRAVPALIPFVAKADNRTDAATSLGLIGDPRGVEPMLATMTATEKLYREAAVVGLRRIVRKTGSASYPPILRDLGSPPPLLRRAAAAALVGANSASLNGPLTSALRDPDDQVRASAASALGWSDNLAAISPLVGALSDPQWRVVSAAVNSLGAVGPAAVAPLLEIIGKSGDRTVNYQITRAFLKIGNTAGPKLISALSSPSLDVRIWSAVTLGDLHYLAAVPPLEKLAKTATGDLKAAVNEQLRVLTGTTGS